MFKKPIVRTIVIGSALAAGVGVAGMMDQVAVPRRAYSSTAVPVTR